MATANELYNLGYYHYTGKNGYPLNYEKAYEYFRQAAEAGSGEAMNYLGIMYQYGYGVVQNYQMAVDWYYHALKASDYENAYAAFNLGYLYYNGFGVPRDIKRAFEFYKVVVGLNPADNALVAKAANMAGYIMSEYYKNDREAVPYFIEAAKRGNIPEAWHSLGWLCEKGVMNVEPEKVKGTALGFYKNAAEQGYAPSMDSVGRIYASVDMMDEARLWIQRAADKGFEPSKKRLKAFTGNFTILDFIDFFKS